MHVTAIVAAGGSGSRLGAGIPKQFLIVGGRMILERSLSAFLDHERVNDVILVLPPDTEFDSGFAVGDGKLRAVHTRHEYTEVSLPGFTSRPEQYYGDCTASY